MHTDFIHHQHTRAVSKWRPRHSSGGQVWGQRFFGDSRYLDDRVKVLKFKSQGSDCKNEDNDDDNDDGADDAPWCPHRQHHHHHHCTIIIIIIVIIFILIVIIMIIIIISIIIITIVVASSPYACAPAPFR